MGQLWIPIASAVLLVVGILAVRLMRSTGLETVAEGFASAEEAKERKGFGDLLDNVGARFMGTALRIYGPDRLRRSEEHTSELQSRGHLVCRLLPEKKKRR